MNFAHLHIVLNHIPSIGTAVGVALFAFSVLKQNNALKKLGLEVIVVMSLLILPTYLSGSAAQRLLRTRSEIPQALIEEHQNSAMVTLVLVTITGTLGWFGLWQFRRFSQPGPGNTWAVLIFSVLTAAFILNTANLGGKISHAEIRAGGSVAAETGWRAPFSSFANNKSWVWPASETVHFIGMALLFGVVLTVNLRMLGMMKSISFAAVHRLLPLGIFGFILNVVSGMTFFIASPELYVGNAGFAAKMLLLVLAGISVIYFTVFDEPWAVGPDKEAPLRAKVVAVTTMTLLLGVMYFGRMLPFLRS
jgi:hypothetical protein